MKADYEPPAGGAASGARVANHNSYYHSGWGPADKLLAMLNNVRGSDGRHTAHCPAHDDRNASLSVRVEGDRVLVKCHAGCGTADVLRAVGLEWSDLFAPGSQASGRGDHNGTRGNGGAAGCTLAAYAEAKRLDPTLLASFGVKEVNHSGAPALRIPYWSADGRELSVRYRTALTKPSEGPDNRFRWPRGAKVYPYGLWRISEARTASYAIMVEGESDCHTLWQANVPALGVPGAACWKGEWVTHFDGVDRVYAVVEPDAGGAALSERLLSTAPLLDRLFLVELPQKDVSDLWLASADEAGLRQALDDALAGAVPARQVLADRERRASEAALGRCRELATAANILDHLSDDVKRVGLVGEERNARLLFLATVSRHLARPVSAVVRGPSSGGKSFLVETVLKFVPECAAIVRSGMSPRALAYGTEPLEHRLLVLYEAEAVASDEGTYLLRTLVSEGCLRYETVDKTSDGLQARLIERPGPVGLLLTTCRTRLDPELTTRLLDLTVTDTPEQTAAVMARLADDTPGDTSAVTAPWEDLGTWLEGAEHRVSVPFAPTLARLVPPVAVTLRRQFAALLNLVRAHALLHQLTRERDAKGRVVATLADYAAVRELMLPILGATVDASVSAELRATVAAVAAIHERTGVSVNLSAVASQLGIDKASASRRCGTARDKGWLVNEETQRGRPTRLVPGDPLPEDTVMLPTVGDLEAAWHGEPDGFDGATDAELEDWEDDADRDCDPPEEDVL